MKNLVIPFLAMFVLVSSCSTKESAGNEEWAEMEAFHELMAAAYHPVGDSSNLGPAKNLADELAVAAKVWSESSLPERVNNVNVRKDLVILRDSSAAFLSAVAGGKPDTLLKSRIFDLHHTFHRLHLAWKGIEEMKH